MGNIDDWLKNFVMGFRKESEKLSEEERKSIHGIDDFSRPCQFLLLCLENINRQYLICDHDNNRGDIEVEIIKTETYEAIRQMETILKDPKWNRNLVEGERNVIFNTGDAFSERLEKVFLKILRDMTSELLRDSPKNIVVVSKEMITTKSFLWNIKGNITEIDKMPIIKHIVSQARENNQRKHMIQSIKRPIGAQALKQTIKLYDSIEGYSTYFYPPTWIGKMPVRHFIEKALGIASIKIVSIRKALNLKYHGKCLVINQDGLIAIGESDISKATRSLNEIMATFLLFGFKVTAIRELELGKTEIELASSSTPFIQRGKIKTLRTALSSLEFDPAFFSGRMVIEESDVTRVINRAESITNDSEISDYLILLMEASTHFENSEYTQCFIMSWFIIEKYLIWIWKEKLKKKGIPAKRMEKLTNTWTAAIILENLNLIGELSESDYNKLMMLKHLRNKIMHASERIKSEEAEISLRTAENYVKQRCGLNTSILD